MSTVGNDELKPLIWDHHALLALNDGNECNIDPLQFPEAGCASMQTWGSSHNLPVDGDQPQESGRSHEHFPCQGDINNDDASNVVVKLRLHRSLMENALVQKIISASHDPIQYYLPRWTCHLDIVPSLLLLWLRRRAFPYHRITTPEIKEWFVKINLFIEIDREYG